MKNPEVEPSASHLIFEEHRIPERLTIAEAVEKVRTCFESDVCELVNETLSQVPPDTTFSVDEIYEIARQALVEVRQNLGLQRA